MQTDSIEVRRTARRFTLFAYTLAATALLVSLLVACGGGGADAGISDAATPLKRIVYQRSVTQANGIGQADLYALNEDGTGEVALATNQGDKTLITGLGRTAIRVGDRVLYYREVPGSLPSVPNREIYSVKVDGTGTALLAASAQDKQVLAVDGDRVVIAGDQTEVLSVKADGRDPVTLAADAEFVAFKQGRVFYNSALGAGGIRLYGVLPDGTGKVELAVGRGFAVSAFEPSDRGKGIDMTAGGRLLLSVASADGKFGLYITDSDATSLTRLGSIPLFVAGLRGWGSQYALYACLPVDERVAYIDSVGSLLSVKLDGTAVALLAPSSANGPFDIVGAAAGRVLYQSRLPNDLPNGLYAVNVNGGRPVALALADSTAATETVAGDGRVLLVTTTSPFELSAINIDGSAPAALASGVHNLLSSGGIDGSIRGRALAVFDKRVVFRRANGAVLNTYSINTDGTGLTTLVGGSDPSDPEAISRERLVFRRVVNEQSDLYSIRPDGTGLATLANGSTDERFGIFCGNKVVYTRLAADGHRDLLIVNGDGGGTRVLSSDADDKVPVGVF